MEHHLYRSHDPGKHLRGCGEAETEGNELINRPTDDKTKEHAAVGGQGLEGKHPSSRGD